MGLLSPGGDLTLILTPILFEVSPRIMIFIYLSTFSELMLFILVEVRLCYPDPSPSTNPKPNLKSSAVFRGPLRCTRIRI